MHRNIFNLIFFPQELALRVFDDLDGSRARVFFSTVKLTEIGRMADIFTHPVACWYAHAHMHMRTDPTSDAVLLGRWPFQCTAFDEMLVNLGTIMEKAARIPESSLSFFCCNTEATGAVGFHWMSAVFEVIAPGIGRRAGQGAAASGAQPNQRLREMKRRKTRRNQPVDQPVHPGCDFGGE